MTKIMYREHSFRPRSLEIIQLANQIIGDYAAQGYSLTLRQLYYQLVARGHLPNQDREYKKLGSLINDARWAGLVDWEAIEDRTRNLRKNSHWGSPKDIIGTCVEQYAIDKWRTQSYYVEVWIEKDALIGVLQSVCQPLDVPYFSCRGYTSASEMWRASERFTKQEELYGKECLLLHLGDHDPSGMDMTRDINERLGAFGANVMVDRIALSMEQIEQYNPPPNPAKMSDARYWTYQEDFGDRSWELDALEPAVLSEIVERGIRYVRDETLWAAAVEEEEDGREVLADLGDSLGEEDEDEDENT